MQDREETFTLQIEDGKVYIAGEQAELSRAKDLGELLSRFSAYVPNLNLTMTRHDLPACRLGWYEKERLIELAELGECEPQLRIHRLVM